MDEWNRYPNNDPQQPKEPNQPSENTPPSEGGYHYGAPGQPTPQNQQPSTPPTNGYLYQYQSPTPPPTYNPYGWNQVPHQQPTPPPKKKRTGVVVGVIAGVCALVIVTLSVLLALASGSNLLPSPPSGNTGPTGSVNGNGEAPKLEITELDENTQGLSARDIIKKNIDSTVLLTVYTTTTTGNNGFPFSQSGQEQEVEAGSATGIVMTSDGYIITNWHCVVNESTNKPFPRIDVKLYNGTVYERATVIGADSSTDLAVIKVNATDLQPADFGDSTALQLGDRVVALGNAGGLGWSATQGIVSGLARDVYEDTGYAIKCLQVDAIINPGNSGGPLFNAAGQVVAVNSAKIVADGYEGMGFAIPINEAKVIIDELLANGYVTGRVSLGITGQTYADAYYRGFLIYTIEEGSPIAKTIARRGDLITAVNNVTIEDYAQLRSALSKFKVGDTVTLTLLRSTNRKVDTFTVEVTLAEAKQ